MAAHLTPAQGASRVLRGGALAGTSASLSVAAHAAAGGSSPDPVTTTVIAVVLAGVGAALADRGRGSSTIVGVLALTQLALHSFLQLSGSHLGRSEHAHHGDMPIDPVSMTVGHLVVAVATGLVLVHAERALFVVAWIAAMLLPVHNTRLPVVVPPRTPPVPGPDPLIPQRTLPRINAPRGPPEIS